MQLLDTREAAEFLKVSPRTLERMRQEGTSPKFRKCGRRVLYAQSDLLDWLDSHAYSSTAEAKRAG